jgi:hypothetical protein
MVTITTPEIYNDVLGYRFDEAAAGPRTWTITASLLAARREPDGQITLAVADPDGRPHRMIVAFPGRNDDVATHPAFRNCVELSRNAFVRDFVDPSEEGFDLLYGKAVLTLALNEGDGLGRCLPRVVGFTALGGNPR